jgi:hypothetical protein
VGKDERSNPSPGSLRASPLPREKAVALGFMGYLRGGIDIAQGTSQHAPGFPSGQGVRRQRALWPAARLMPEDQEVLKGKEIKFLD